MSQNMDAGERPLELKPIIGLVGVLIAALTVGLNDRATAIAMSDIRGGLGISSDPGTWLTSLYATGQVVGMGICTWIAVTVTIRRFALFAFALCGAATVLCACTDNLTLLLVLRFLQGMGGGFIIPLLLTSGIRLLGPQIRLFGLAAYALTATFAPNISTTVAALWVDVVGWRFAFFQDLPLFAVAGVLAWYGLPQDSPRYERLKQFDWRGVVLVIILAFALVTVLEQGDRLDWFNSNLICVLSLVSVITVPLLVVNEIYHPLPLFRPQLLKRRNFAYAIIALFLFLLFVQSSSTVPAAILTQVQGFRPSQIYPITLGVGMAQLALLPLMAIVLNITWVDARIVSFMGLSCMLAACIGDSFVASSAQAGFFYVWQALQTIGEPMVIMALLMISTNEIRDASDGPFASTMVNGMRAIAEPTGVWMLQLIMRWRGGLHYNRLVDQIGQTRFQVIQAPGLIPGNFPPLLPDGRPRSPGALGALMASIQTQTTILTLSDAVLIFGALIVVLMVVLLVLPVRTYPPRIVLAQKK